MKKISRRTSAKTGAGKSGAERNAARVKQNSVRAANREKPTVREKSVNRERFANYENSTTRGKYENRERPATRKSTSYKKSPSRGRPAKKHDFAQKNSGRKQDFGKDFARNNQRRTHILRKSQCDFVAGVASPQQMPRDLLSRPQIAFAGRSNVGKSSIINCLIGQRNLARVSKTPGRTQQINFFDVAGKMLLADLPGYGYATVGQGTRRNWDKLMSYYFENTPQLRRVFLLIDARVGLKDSDHALMDFLDKLAIVYQIVLTKIDKISLVEETVQQIQAEISQHPAAYGEILTTSATKKTGISQFNRKIIECFS